MKKEMALAVAVSAFRLFAFDDEPDELNWDTLGGGVTGFAHFAKYCEDNPDFKDEVLALEPLSPLDGDLSAVWIKPGDFEGAKIMNWSFGEIDGVKTLFGGAGHVLGPARCAFEIPSDGLYRVWVKYWHETNSVGSFSLAIEDGRLADFSDASLSVVQNAYNWRFDWSEWMRKNRLPTHRDEPTGWIWEAGPMARFEAGRKSLTLSGLVHDGPFAPRQIAAVVLTKNPFGNPDEAPAAPDAELANLWNHRPVVDGATRRHKSVWRRWRKAFLGDIVSGAIPGVEAGRMASYVYFDDESNLIGPPADVEAEKASFAAALARHKRDCFQIKLEGEDFEFGKAGWWKEPNFGSSGGKVLATDDKGGEADAFCDFEIPADGTYQIWPCYLETEGKLSKFAFRVEDAQGNVLAERLLAADADFNRDHAGRNWVRMDVSLKAGVNRVRVVRDEPSEAYRRLDAVIVTDNPGFVADGFGLVATALDGAKPLTVWRESDPWRGYTRTEGPKKGEGLGGASLQLREGEAETILLLVRNNNPAEAVEIVPEIAGDADGLVMWRVPAFMQSGWVCGWQPMPLLRRESLFVPAGQTAGIWLTVEGKEGFSPREIAVAVGGETFTIDVKRAEALPPETPVPYILGWSTPYPRFTTWEYYRKLGINVIGDAGVPAEEARRYGIRVNVRFNDGTVTAEHVKEMRDRQNSLGYRTDEWAWSFMDEPGNAFSDQWVELAKKLREYDKDIKIWVNPGEIEGASPQSNMKLTPWVDYYCPYHNHWTTRGWGDEKYFDQLMRRGEPKFDILMGYTTPCFIEKAPTAPKDMLYLKDFALKYNLDGWAFFAFTYAFTYCNSPWDDQNNYLADQAVSLYQGAGYETISTRNAEAIREAKQLWRRAKAGK
ncbi:MAG: hypothetical protein ILO34_00780 [Kiritimatiellae bacterium]|nr:hypothetical protein [Kiritimatiellia bacterium]